MAFEIECGSCSGRFEVAEGSTIVVCPHCSMTLQLPGPPEGETSGGETPAEGPISGFPVGAESVTENELPTINTGEETPSPNINAGQDSQLPFINTGDEPQPASSDSAVAVVDAPPVTAPAPEEPAKLSAETVSDSRIFPGFGPEASEPVAADGNFAAAIAGLSESETEAVAFSPAADDGPVTTASSSQPLLPDSTEVEPVAAPAAAEKATPAKQHKGPSQTAYLIMAGYASVITLLFAWLYYTHGRIHPLESLPDVEPQKVGSFLIPEDAPMPRGHTLRLGETQRFGNLKVTPLKVTRGPMTLQDTLSDWREPTTDVLRLWLKIENVSSSQHIMPFGRKLMLLRGTPKGREKEAANIFVGPVSEKKRGGKLVLMFLIPEEMELKDQQIDRELSPGDEYTTFLSSRELNSGELSEGELVWRVHIRKGYNAESKRGVTTVFEVTFNANEIQKESNAG